MMNAIDELREIYLNAPVARESLKDIIERIKAEYIELPRDKNGDVIHVGDVIKLQGTTEKMVRGIGIINGLPCVFYWLKGMYGGDFADRCKLVKQDSYERIEEDIKLLPNDYVKKYPECFKGFDSDGHAQRKDILRRCKALAGVG